MSILSFMVRQTFGRGDKKRDAGLSDPADVRRDDDLSYGPYGKWNLLDLYRPVNAEGPLPVIVSVHGGGWVYGTKEVYQYYCMSLAQQGFAVVNFNYRLAPEHKFPAQLEDVNRLFGWVLAHVKDYGLDSRRIYAVGDSAGAHLLGLYSCICTDRDYAAGYPFRPPEGFVPRAVALNCGMYQVSTGGKGDTTAGLMRDLLPGKGSREELHRISVLEHVSAAFPPSFVMTAEGDFLAGQAQPLVQRLQALGVDTEYQYYGDKEHPLGHVFHCNIRLPDAARCNRDECEFFRRHS